MALNRITANRVTLRRMTGPSLGITQTSFIEYLVLAGGGGSYDGSGQSIYAQGGGGAGGGLRTGLAFPAVGAVLQVTVGGGGSGSSSGSNSSITFNNPAVWSNVVCDGGGRGAFFGYPGIIDAAYRIFSAFKVSGFSVSIVMNGLVLKLPEYFCCSYAGLLNCMLV